MNPRPGRQDSTDGAAPIIDACRTPRGIGKQGSGSLGRASTLDELERTGGRFALVGVGAHGSAAPEIEIVQV